VGTFLVGREPVFDATREVLGYELLWRDPFTASLDGVAMTADVLLVAGLDLGLASLVGEKLAFVKLTRSFLVGELAMTLPPERTVVEVVVGTGHDAAVLEGCRRLVDAGFRLALDAYTEEEGDEPLLEMASIVKLDLVACAGPELLRQVRRCSAFGVTLLADKVETPSQLSVCQALGFELFQGHLLSRPGDVSARALSPNQLTCLRVIAKLCDPDVSADEVAKIIETDAALSYRFLRIASAGPVGGFAGQLTSVRHGVVMLGTRRLRDWTTLMCLEDSREGSAEHLVIAMTRARMCELLAEELHPRLGESAFTVGLVSALDLILETALSNVVANLSLTDELRAGLLERAYRGALAWATETCGLLETSKPPATSGTSGTLRAPASAARAR